MTGIETQEELNTSLRISEKIAEVIENRWLELLETIKKAKEEQEQEEAIDNFIEKHSEFGYSLTRKEAIIKMEEEKEEEEIRSNIEKYTRIATDEEIVDYVIEHMEKWYKIKIGGRYNVLIATDDKINIWPLYGAMSVDVIIPKWMKLKIEGNIWHNNVYDLNNIEYFAKRNPYMRISEKIADIIENRWLELLETIKKAKEEQEEQEEQEQQEETIDKSF